LLRVAASWALVSLVLLSLSAAKRALYLLPALPAWALLGAWWFALIAEQSPAPLTRWPRAIVLLTTWAIGLGSAGFVIAAFAMHLPQRGLATLAAIPAGITGWLLWRGRIVTEPRRTMPWLLVAAQLAVAALAPSFERRADKPEDSIEEARSTLQREAGTAARVVTFQLGERGRSVVSLAFARVIDSLDDPAHLSFDDATSSVLLIADNETSPSALARLAKHARVAQVLRTPMGRQSLVLYRLAPKLD
jgi:4-amino-4-deoxy-L-arabinose transferase-like glycosyltransferase